MSIFYHPSWISEWLILYFRIVLKDFTSFMQDSRVRIIPRFLHEQVSWNLNLQWTFTLGLALSSALDVLITAFLFHFLLDSRRASSSYVFPDHYHYSSLIAWRVAGWPMSLTSLWSTRSRMAPWLGTLRNLDSMASGLISWLTVCLLSFRWFAYVLAYLFLRWLQKWAFQWVSMPSNLVFMALHFIIGKCKPKLCWNRVTVYWQTDFKSMLILCLQRALVAPILLLPDLSPS